MIQVRSKALDPLTLVKRNLTSPGCMSRASNAMQIQMVAQKEKVKARFAGPSGPPCRCCIITVVMTMLFVVATVGLSEGKRRLVERTAARGLVEFLRIGRKTELGAQNFRTWSLLMVVDKKKCKSGGMHVVIVVPPTIDRP